MAVSNNLSLSELLQGARKREVLRLLLDRLSLSLAAAMVGLILLLLLGTQILEWYWVAGLVVIGIGVGIWKLGSALPSLYQLAQRIDNRLQLADVLSTAHYFAENPDPTKQSVCVAQHRGAQETARTVDLVSVVPIERSRFLLPALGLAAVAAGLFAVRYMTTGSMSLQPSLVTAAYDTFFGNKMEQAKNLKQDKKSNLDPQVNADSPENQTMENEKPPEDLLNANDAQNPSEGKDNSKESADSPKDKQDKQDKGEDANASDEQNDGKDKGDNQSKQDGKDKQGDSNQSKESSSDQKPQSAMDKLKDAVQNLMNSMKPEKQDSQQQQNAKNQGKSQKSDQQKGQKGEKSKSESQPDASADQQGEEGSQETSDNKSSQKSQDKNNQQQDSKNGIGSQDGDKARKAAEQLEAMGKISQIIGQRSQQITGEVTIEVGQSKQQLKTAWTASEATHHDAGSETHRDEVPLAYQEFVRQYFEKIHNSAPAAPASTKPPAAVPDPKRAIPTP